MTEPEWNACTSPGKMLAFLRGKASNRKNRLFACALGRQLIIRIAENADARSLQSLDAGERFADGLLGEKEYQGVCEAAQNVVLEAVVEQDFERAAWARDLRVAAEYAESVRGIARFARPWVACALIRDLFGNPFRPVVLAPALLAWQGSTVPRLAQAAYDDRDLPAGTLQPARLAVLADALEEAGCQNLDLLGHLRGPGPHYRGCWAVDTILAKT